MAAQTLSSFSETRLNHRNYDVFLSFRGEDTRKAFTDHLYSALVRTGIRTFRDDDELPRGENISLELINAIGDSRISIVVFSQGYASSRWCLDELVEILRCTKTKGHSLIPIFYDVNPSDVRKQTGPFAEAFVSHENIERVQRWKAALTEAADKSGWDLENVANGYEANFIDKIVDQVFCKVRPVRLYVNEHLVGTESHVENIKASLELGTSDVRIVGIYGMGGIGKTTLAKVVYNQICHRFEGSSCLLNIREHSEQFNGLVHLQEQLLSDVLKVRNLKINYVEEGIKLIEERIRGKRVLLVLDDVNDLEQIYTIVGHFKWFGPRSTIIVTTRDRHLVTQLEAHVKYEVPQLDLLESLQLFSWHAFGRALPREDYLEISMRAANYAGGVPLALEVLGSFLKGRSVAEWEIELKILQRSPHDKIQKIFRTSFNSLDQDRKVMFLDIACFFVSMDHEYVTKILEGCGFFTDSGINILRQRSLITIDFQNKLRMHDLIRDMGRKIVHEESPNNPGKRSRLWFHKDIFEVLRNNNMGSKKVEGLVLNLPILDDVHFNTEAFVKMKSLRLLQIQGVDVTGCSAHLSKELRWLSWHKCPLKYLPYLENLVVLDMQHSTIKKTWKETNVLNKLKVINLSHSMYLTKSPNFFQVPHLEILILEGCTNLVEVHASIGCLKRLLLLNLEGCKNLRNLPRSIYDLKSLETLNLSGCLKLEELSEQVGNMTALKELLVDRTGIKELPSSFGLLKNLKTLSLSGCKGESSKSWWTHFPLWISPHIPGPRSLLPASILGLCSLEKLNLSYCNLSEDEIPVDLGGLPSLRSVDLSGNNFHSLPHCISSLRQLKCLYLRNCSNLQSISELPIGLEKLHADRCASIARIADLPLAGTIYSCGFCHSIEFYAVQDGVPSFGRMSYILVEGYKSKHELGRSFLQMPRVSRQLQMESGDEIKVSVKIHDGQAVNQCGIHLQVKKPVRDGNCSKTHFLSKTGNVVCLFPRGQGAFPRKAGKGSPGHGGTTAQCLSCALCSPFATSYF